MRVKISSTQLLKTQRRKTHLWTNWYSSGLNSRKLRSGVEITRSPFRIVIYFFLLLIQLFLVFNNALILCLLLHFLVLQDSKTANNSNTRKILSHVFVKEEDTGKKLSCDKCGKTIWMWQSLFTCKGIDHWFLVVFWYCDSNLSYWRVIQWEASSTSLNFSLSQLNLVIPLSVE